jgi:hypothetical protein
MTDSKGTKEVQSLDSSSSPSSPSSPFDDFYITEVIKIVCYGKPLEIPIKYKKRIGIIAGIKDGETIFLEIPEYDMLQVLCVLRDHFQVLDKSELEKLKIEYSWSKGFMKHFDYLGIDTDAISLKRSSEKESVKDEKEVKTSKSRICHSIIFGKKCLRLECKYAHSLDEFEPEKCRHGDKCKYISPDCKNIDKIRPICCFMKTCKCTFIHDGQLKESVYTIRQSVVKLSLKRT